MKRWFTSKNIYWFALLTVAVALVSLTAVDVFGRVGGGHSYGGGGSRGGGGGSHGGSGGGSGDGGAIIWLIFQAVRLLVYLTIEYPLIGIPLDIVVFVGIIYFLRQRGKRITTGFSSMAAAVQQAAASTPEMASRSFERLKKFDPNFSEIVFTDFCYALYGKAHDARAGGSSKLDL